MALAPDWVSPSSLRLLLLALRNFSRWLHWVWSPYHRKSPVARARKSHLHIRPANQGLISFVLRTLITHSAKASSDFLSFLQCWLGILLRPGTSFIITGIHSSSLLTVLEDEIISFVSSVLFYDGSLYGLS